MKYDIHKIKEFHKKLLEENPHYNDELVMELAENMPDEYAKKIQYDYWGCHIYSEECYEEEIRKLKITPKWTADDLKKVSNIDFEAKEYYLWDFLFLMNFFYAINKHVFTDTSYYIGLVKSLLENPYTEKSDDFAYKIAKMIK